MMNDISSDSIRAFFDHFKSTCPIFLRHKFDKDRRCVKCGISSMANWQLTTEGHKYYETYVHVLEKKEIQKKILNILNKITGDNIDKLLEQFADIVIKDIYTEIQLNEAIQLIFNKIINEPNYMKMYIILCMKLSKVTIKSKIKDLSDNDIDIFKPKYKKYSFKNGLLNLAMTEYYKYLDKAYSKKLSSPEKTRMINIIYFIAELYNHDIICSNIIHNFIQRVLYKDNYVDENWEALCKLLITVGKKIDKSPYVKFINDYFNKFIEVYNNLEINTRMYYLTLNVIEARSNNWP